jgi:trimethylamine:corrinoid methyltransferase-like protein
MAQVMRTVIPLGVPMNFHTAPQTAASAPFTLAGLIAQYNTEMVCALVSSQIIKKGAPCIYGGGWGTSDLQKLQRHLGSPEAALLRIAGAQMARFYGVPSHGIGPDTDAQSVDPRNGWEKMLSCLALVGAGTDLIINAGMFGTAMNMSLSQLVIDHEIIGAARRCSQGLLVDRERLAEEVIREAGWRILDSDRLQDGDLPRVARARRSLDGSGFRVAGPRVVGWRSHPSHFGRSAAGSAKRPGKQEMTRNRHGTGCDRRAD